MLAQTPTDPTDAAAWGAYIAALRSSLQTSWAGARNSYLTLKKVRAELGFPFIAPPVGESGVPDNGAWSDSLEGNILDLQAMVKVTDDALGDVLAQKRKLFYDQGSNDYAVEGLPSDLVRVRMNQVGQLSLVDATNQTIHVGGTIGLAPIIIGGAVAAAALSGAVVFVGAALVIKKTCETVQVVAEQKTLQTALTKQAELVQSGKATPAEAAALTKGVYDGAAQLATAKGEAEAKKNENSDVSNVTKTVTTVAFIGLGIGVIYLLAKMIPAGGLKRSPALLENPQYTRRAVWSVVQVNGARRKFVAGYYNSRRRAEQVSYALERKALKAFREGKIMYDFPSFEVEKGNRVASRLVRP